MQTYVGSAIDTVTASFHIRGPLRLLRYGYPQRQSAPHLPQGWRGAKPIAEETQVWSIPSGQRALNYKDRFGNRVYGVCRRRSSRIPPSLWLPQRAGCAFPPSYPPAMTTSHCRTSRRTAGELSSTPPSRRWWTRAPSQGLAIRRCRAATATLLETVNRVVQWVYENIRLPARNDVRSHHRRAGAEAAGVGCLPGQDASGLGDAARAEGSHAATPAASLPARPARPILGWSFTTPDRGWLGADPTKGLILRLRRCDYVKLGVGRDFTDVSPGHRLLLVQRQGRGHRRHIRT